MEIKLSAGDRINIPENCKATIEDDLIVIEEKKEEQEDFKDGDVLHSKVTSLVVIFKSYENNSNEIFCSHYNNSNESKSGWIASNFRHATEEEKQAFFDRLKAKGLRWNAETKEMERIRRRVKEDEAYLYIHCSCEVFETIDARIPFDDTNFKVGNYYPLEERAQAEEDAKAIKAIFEKRLKVK